MLKRKIYKHLKYLSTFPLVETQHRYLLVLSHMRARTTLLTHILASNSAICGHKESYISYDRVFAKSKLKIECCLEHNYRHAKYLVDKLLHNHLNVDPLVFSPGQLKLIVMLREPAASISSMANMHKKLHDNERYHHLAGYYEERLHMLQGYAKSLAGSYFYLDADRLVDDTEQVLLELSHYLELEQPLTPEYKVFKDTGVAGLGDPSKNIKSGKIIKQKSDELEVVTKDDIERLDNLYHQVRKMLIDNAVNKDSLG